MNDIVMKRWLLFLPLAFLVLMTGCRDEFSIPEPPCEIPEGKLTAVFTLSIPNLSPVSRADSDIDAEKEGEIWENYIDLNGEDYRFLFFVKDDTDNWKYFETLQVEKFIKTSDDAINMVSTYLVEGIVSRELAEKSSVKVLALANWGEYFIPREVGVTTIEDICTSQGGIFTYNLKGCMPSEENRIPMFGVTNPQRFSFDSSTRKSWMDGIFMLRAYAKIEVNASFSGYKETESLKCNLKQVTIDRYNSKGFKAPKGIVNSTDYVSNSSGSWTSSKVPLHIPVAAGAQVEDVAFNTVYDENNTTRFVLYVPEYQNVNMDGLPRDQRAEMTLTFELPNSKGDALITETAKLEFKYYSDLGDNMKEGDYFNICRNVWYRYNVKKSPTTLIVDMQPYASIDLNPNFGLTRDEEGNIIVRDENGKIIKVIAIGGENTKVTDVLVGDMSYVEVKFNDVIKFREFNGADGKPDGRRQDFLLTGWNMFDKDGNMEACYIYNDTNHGNKASYSKFRFGNLTERWIGCTENSDQTDRVGGIQDVKTNRDGEHDDQYNISYRKDLDSDDWEILQTILEVYDVDKNGNQNREKLLTILVEDGNVNLDKERVKLNSEAIEEQYAVEVYEDADGVKTLKYRFFVDGSYQLLYKNKDGTYDWDFYNEEGWRFSGFDHDHPGYDNKTVFSRYDKWGNIIERSIDAQLDEKNIVNPKHGIMIVDNTVDDSGNMTIRHRQKDSNGKWLLATDSNGNDLNSNWKDIYQISQYGDKIVLIYN